ncbi:hypothetical protein EFK38_01455 [Lactococcus lactis subsp. lactis]|nr:hypothetical protein [Lactococcus lactis subsp. lactis]
MIKLYQKLQTIAKRYIFNVLFLFLPKGTAEPLHEMLSMKLPAELFRGTRKTRTKETGNCLFCLLGVWGKRPILTTESWQSLPLGIGRQPPIIWHEVTNVYWVILLVRSNHRNVI